MAAACKTGKKSCKQCGAKIDENTAKFVTDHEGQKYYFCSGECQREFSSEGDIEVKY